MLARFARDLPARLPRRRGYRFRSARRGAMIDLARSLRAAIRTDGDVMALNRRRRATRPRPILLLIDVSGSMKQRSDANLALAHVIMQSAPRVEVFTFGTRLTRVTRALKLRNRAQALAQASGLVADWDGGTRIGDALAPSSPCRALPAMPEARWWRSSPTGWSGAIPRHDRCCPASRGARFPDRLAFRRLRQTPPTSRRPKPSWRSGRFWLRSPMAIPPPPSAGISCRSDRAERPSGEGGMIDAHFHIWRQADLPWLMGPMQPRIFGPYEPIRRDYPIEEYLADCAAGGSPRGLCAGELGAGARDGRGPLRCGIGRAGPAFLSPSSPMPTCWPTMFAPASMRWRRSPPFAGADAAALARREPALSLCRRSRPRP